jgi:hypothetical protein
MFNLFFLWAGALAHAFRSRRHLILENLALRQQLSAARVNDFETGTREI